MQNNSIESNEWISTKEAAELLGKSPRHVRTMIAEGKLQAKRKGHTWLIHSSLSVLPGVALELPSDSERRLEASVRELKADNERYREEIKELQAQLKEERLRADDGRERQDTLMLQLTRQLENQQRLIEYRPSWFRRAFRKARKPPEAHEID